MKHHHTTPPQFDLSENSASSAKIIVIGVGGGGCNTVQQMVNQDVIKEVEFVCANTDAQALRTYTARQVLQLGPELTKGLGAGANPEIGKRAAQEDRIRIQELLTGADMVFITAGMGGGTGTGAAPVIAEIARDLGILTVAVVTKPFPFEGRKRSQVAEAGIMELAQKVDSLITIPNEKLLAVLGKNVSLLDAFKAVNNVLQGAVQGISELITQPGLINVDFADVRTVMSEMGMAMMGTASARGENRAREAAEAAVASPLLEDIALSGAKGVLVNITAGMDMTIGEFEEVGEVVKSFTSEQATVVVGTVIDPEMSDELRVTIVVTGLSSIPTDSHLQMRYHGGQNSFQSSGRSSIVRRPTTTAYNNKYAPHGNSAPQPHQNERVDLLETTGASMGSNANSDYLDIPTFLRRQTD